MLICSFPSFCPFDNYARTRFMGFIYSAHCLVFTHLTKTRQMHFLQHQHHEAVQCTCTCTTDPNSYAMHVFSLPFPCFAHVGFTLTFFPQMVEKGANLLKRMEISVAEAEKRTGKNAVGMQETYTVYLIETRYVTMVQGHTNHPYTYIFQSDPFYLQKWINCIYFFRN